MLKRDQKGFTFVEIILVVVLLGGIITAGYYAYHRHQTSTKVTASATTSPTPAKGTSSTDSARQSDIGYLYAQIEAYWTANVQYPTLAQLNDSSWRATNLSHTQTAPFPYVLASSPSSTAYAYQPTTDDGSPCDDISTSCTKYTLTATLSSGQLFQKQNAN